MSFAATPPKDQGTLMTETGRVYGVAVGIVTNNQDPDKLGRVKVQLPWLVEQDESDWAPVATLMAGKERGSFFLPEVDDEVLVGFAHGDPRYPFVLGALWNGKDAPPETNEDGKNAKRVIVSRSGLRILLDDSDGAEKVEVADKEGALTIVVDVAAKKISLTSNGEIELAAADGAVSINAKELKLESSADTTIKAGGSMTVEASSTLTLKGSTVNIN